MTNFKNVLPTLRFSREFGLVFFWICWFFEDLQVACFWLVLIKICLFFELVFCRFLFCGLLFFRILWHFCFLDLLQNQIWACFWVNLHILCLFFRICFPAFIFNFLAGFMFFEFSYRLQVGLVFFPLNCLFWACFTNLFACFYKITWHHCL